MAAPRKKRPVKFKDIPVPPAPRWSIFLPDNKVAKQARAAVEANIMTQYDPVSKRYLSVQGMFAFKDNQKEQMALHINRMVARMDPEFSVACTPFEIAAQLVALPNDLEGCGKEAEGKVIEAFVFLLIALVSEPKYGWSNRRYYKPEGVAEALQKAFRQLPPRYMVHFPEVLRKVTAEPCMYIFDGAAEPMGKAVSMKKIELNAEYLVKVLFESKMPVPSTAAWETRLREMGPQAGPEAAAPEPEAL